MVASSGAQLLEDDAVGALLHRLLPLATVVTPNVPEARALTGSRGPGEGRGAGAADHLFDGSEHHEIPFERSYVAATHGAGCTQSATLAALLARGLSLLDAARGAAAAASRAVAEGHAEIGAGDGPVDVLGVAAG